MPSHSNVRIESSGVCSPWNTPRNAYSLPSGSRCTNPHVPPWCASLWTSVFVRYLGPIHCAMRSGSVMARKTLSIGASNSGLIVLAWLPSFVISNVSVVFMVLSLSWWSVERVEKIVETLEALAPVRPVVRQPSGGLLERCCLEVAQSHRAELGAGDQAGLLEHLEVLGHCRLRHREQPREVSHVGVLLSEPSQDGATGAVGQGAEHEVELIVTHSI